MERDVFTLPKVKELFAKFVIVGLKTDIKNKRINELYAKYKDTEDPTIPLYIVLDHEEKSLGFIHATLGLEPNGDEDNGPPPSAFIKFLETASAKSVTGAKPADPTPKPAPKPKGEMQQGATADPAKGFNTDEFLWFLLEAFGVGLITLLTPCVLPVLPLTIGFFVKQAEQKRPALITAGIYCGVILVTFTSIGVIASLALGASGAGDIARSWWLNLGLGMLFIVLALSFLGMFELRMPSFLTMRTSQAQFQANKAGKGYVAAMISGTSFTLISFSCTGPFAAYVLARAASGDVILPAIGMLAYASGMALPIFIMGQFPSLMKSLPKSGSWMNAIKVVFGLMELALAFAYLGFAEFALRNGPPEIFSKNLVVAIWVACAFAAGFYLFGMYRLPHDHEKVEQIGVVRAIFAIVFLCLGAFMMPMLFGAPLGNLGAVIPPGPKDAPSAFGAKGDGESGDKLKPPVKTMELAKAEAKKTQRPIFIDFTGPA
jgi:thiol:disulfide interchange protein